MPLEVLGVVFEVFMRFQGGVEVCWNVRVARRAGGLFICIVVTSA